MLRLVVGYVDMLRSGFVCVCVGGGGFLICLQSSHRRGAPHFRPATEMVFDRLTRYVVTVMDTMRYGYNQGCGAGAGAGAGAAGADTFWSEPEPEPEPPKRFTRSRSRSRSRKKRCGSGSEKGYNCGKITECKQRNNKPPNKQIAYIFHQ